MGIEVPHWLKIQRPGRDVPRWQVSVDFAQQYLEADFHRLDESEQGSQEEESLLLAIDRRLGNFSSSVLDARGLRIHPGFVDIMDDAEGHTFYYSPDENEVVQTQPHKGRLAFLSRRDLTGSKIMSTAEWARNLTLRQGIVNGLRSILPGQLRAAV